jgi:hypothetical protein
MRYLILLDVDAATVSEYLTNIAEGDAVVKIVQRSEGIRLNGEEQPKPARKRASPSTVKPKFRKLNDSGAVIASRELLLAEIKKRKMTKITVREASDILENMGFAPNSGSARLSELHKRKKIGRELETGGYVYKVS